MGTEKDAAFPMFSPDITLTVNIAAGALTLSSATLNNYGDFVYGNPSSFHLVGAVLVNGIQASALAFNSGSGAISLSSAVAVAASDSVEIRFEADAHMTDGWANDLHVRRSLLLTVGAGNQSVTFSSTSNPMPIPAFDMSFGWSGLREDLKVAIKVSSDDSASQDLGLITRRFDPASDTSTATIDLDSAATQTHTAAFTKTQVGTSGKFQILLVMSSGGGTPRQEEHLTLTFANRASVPGYAGNLPTDSLLAQSRVSPDHAQWDLA